MALQAQDPHAGVWVVEDNKPTGRRLPIKTKLVELDGDYAGWTATVRTNAPFSNFLKLAALSESDGREVLAALGELYALLPKLVFGWNFVDEDGQPLPCNAAGFAQLPADLMVQLISAVNGSAGDDGPKG